MAEFLAQHVRPYDPVNDDYDRPPFAADIKEGKNDPIYNAHSYHTKVPPRSIIPYILHYSQPGDLVLDPFCGSGMTGVATQMCAAPPPDLLVQFADLADRVGPRACILNDLSPAACHIAHNYNTPVDVDALRSEYERIKAAVKSEFDWLYGTEHYEPAVGQYDPTKLEVSCRLTNPPDDTTQALFEGEPRKWILVSKEEVESRLGYPVAELPRDKEWGDLNVANVARWICIPAIIQYTIWSDVYRCEGLVTIEEPTGKISTRGKNAGKPMVKRKRVPRGCGSEIILWHAAVGLDGEVFETFKCPHCSVEWKKMQIPRTNLVPVVVNLSAVGIRQSKKGVEAKRIRYNRAITLRERGALCEIESRSIPYWVPATEMDTKGPKSRRNALQVREIRKVTDFWTHRNLWAYASLWDKASAASDPRIGESLRFCVTAITYYVTEKQAWGSGGGGLSGQLVSVVVFRLREKCWLMSSIERSSSFDVYGSARWLATSQVAFQNGSATSLFLPDQSIDYIFTDPPFGSNIYYSEPNLLWEAWLGKITKIQEEAVVHRKNDGGTKALADYARLMQAAFSENVSCAEAGPMGHRRVQ